MRDLLRRIQLKLHERRLDAALREGSVVVMQRRTESMRALVRDARAAGIVG